jgi:hypothetical protein
VAIDAIRDIELIANPDIGLGIRGACQFVLGSQRTGHEQSKNDFPHIDVSGEQGHHNAISELDQIRALPYR